MSDRAPFPDTEALLLDLLADLATTGTVTPADLQAQLPFVRLQRIGGTDDGFTDTATVAVDSFADTRTGAQALAEAVRQRLVNGRSHTVDGVLLDSAATVNAPALVPWSNTQDTFRFAASYRVTARRPTEAT